MSCPEVLRLRVLHRVMKTCSLGHHDAEDLIQEATFRFHRSYGRELQESDLKLLVIIATNISRDRLRSIKRQKKRDQKEAPPHIEAAYFEDFYASLSKTQQRELRMWYSGVTLEQVAEREEIKLASVRKRRRRIRQQYDRFLKALQKAR